MLIIDVYLHRPRCPPLWWQDNQKTSFFQARRLLKHAEILLGLRNMQNDLQTQFRVTKKQVINDLLGTVELSKSQKNPQVSRRVERNRQAERLGVTIWKCQVPV